MMAIEWKCLMDLWSPVGSFQIGVGRANRKSREEREELIAGNKLEFLREKSLRFYRSLWVSLLTWRELAEIVQSPRENSQEKLHSVPKVIAIYGKNSTQGGFASVCVHCPTLRLFVWATSIHRMVDMRNRWILNYLAPYTRSATNPFTDFYALSFISTQRRREGGKNSKAVCNESFLDSN